MPLLCVYRLHAVVHLHLTPPAHLYTLSLHDALPISHTPYLTPLLSEDYFGYREIARMRRSGLLDDAEAERRRADTTFMVRSEEHTSELQSRFDLVCRLLLEKKKRRGCAQIPPHRPPA